MEKQGSETQGDREEDDNAVDVKEAFGGPSTKLGVNGGSVQDEKPSIQVGGSQQASEVHHEVNGTNGSSNEKATYVTNTSSKNEKAAYVGPRASRPGVVAVDSKPAGKTGKSDELSLAAASDEPDSEMGIVSGMGDLESPPKDYKAVAHDDGANSSSKAKARYTGPRAVRPGAVEVDSKPPAKTRQSDDFRLAATSDQTDSKVGAMSVTGENASPPTGGFATAKGTAPGNPSLAPAYSAKDDKTLNSKARSASNKAEAYLSKDSKTRDHARGSTKQGNDISVEKSTTKGSHDHGMNVNEGSARTRRDRRREIKNLNDDRNDTDDEEMENGDAKVGAVPIAGIGSRSVESRPLERVTNDTLVDHHPSSDPTSVSAVVNPEGLATAIPVTEDEETVFGVSDPNATYYTAEVLTEDEVRKGWKGFMRRNLYPMCILAVLLVTGTIVGTIFGVRASDKNVVDPEAVVLRNGSSRFQQAAKILLEQDVSDRDVLLNPSLTTPQYLALTWLADDDEAEIDLSDEIKVIQRYSLAVLFLSTGGEDAWNNTLGFTSGLDECQWSSGPSGTLNGVTACSEEGIVTALRLVDNNLTGTMPHEFGSFLLVKSVEFSDNSNLEGSIPTTIGLLTNLGIFSIENSNVAGAIPAEIGGATSLVEIRAANNQLTGSIPPQIGELTLLKTLSLEGNELSGSLPDDIGLLLNLEDLFVQQNFLNGTIPTTVSSMEALRQIDLSFNLFTDGADNICAIENADFSLFKADCLSQDLPAIPEELPCTCCTLCCSENNDDCLAPTLDA